MANPKPPFEQIPIGLNQNGAQQFSAREVACGICGTPVGLDECKIDEDGAAVHARCYLEKVSARNGAKS